MASQGQRLENDVRLEKEETFIRTVGKDLLKEGGGRTGFPDLKNNPIPEQVNDISSSELDLSGYLLGICHVVKKSLCGYKDIAVDVIQSLFVLFLQYPSVGIFCLVTVGFVAAPVVVFGGFAIVSLSLVVVSSIIFQGILLVAGFIGFLFAVPIAFLAGLVAAMISASIWIILNAIVKVVRGKGILADLVKED